MLKSILSLRSGAYEVNMNSSPSSSYKDFLCRYIFGGGLKFDLETRTGAGSLRVELKLPMLQDRVRVSASADTLELMPDCFNFYFSEL